MATDIVQQLIDMINAGAGTQPQADRFRAL
jgi:hypothetical protein